MEPTRIRNGKVLEQTISRPVRAGVAAQPDSPSGVARGAKAGAPALRQGSILRGRYVLERMIGQGAMGQVWRARDRLSEEARDQSPFIAVKVMNADLESHPDAFVSMHRESSRTQKLAHPNIVTVHVFDQDDASGRVFIAMELLEGKPLDELLRTAQPGGLPRAMALSIVRGLAEGLAYAHRKGIVHSDFKPGNVFISRDGTPKILDFGIARAIRRPMEAASGDADGGFQGYTPAYAAPEMIEEVEPHPADDVFALGIVGYELFSGRHPFGRRHAIDARERGLHPRPIAELRGREWKVLERALAFRREDRWADGAAFSAALARKRSVWKALAAIIVLLALLAAAQEYRSFRERAPAVAFEQLSAQVQKDFQRAMLLGEESLSYLRRSGDITASADAADFFARAYSLHPRNPAAVRGLETAADAAIGWYRGEAERDSALEQLRAFQAKSPHYAKYSPLVAAIQEAERGL